MVSANALPADLLPRLARIEGQVRGLARMVEEGRPCPEVLDQLAAATAALARVRDRLFEGYLDACVERIASAPTQRARRAAVADAVKTLKKAR